MGLQVYPFSDNCRYITEAYMYIQSSTHANIHNNVCPFSWLFFQKMVMLHRTYGRWGRTDGRTYVSAKWDEAHVSMYALCFNLKFNINIIYNAQNGNMSCSMPKIKRGEGEGGVSDKFKGTD